MSSFIAPLVVSLSSYLHVTNTPPPGRSGEPSSTTTNPSRTTPSLPCWNDLSQVNKLRSYGHVLATLTGSFYYIVVHFPDARRDRLKGEWQTFMSYLWCKIRQAVFDDEPGEPTYVRSMDMTPPGNLLSPGILCVNPKTGLHLNLALHVPDHLYDRLIAFLKKLNRKIHRDAAKAAGLKPPKPFPSIFVKGMGAAVHIQEITDAKGGPVQLVAGYFADRLDQALRIAKEIGLTVPKGSQLAFASADIRDEAAALYGELKASASRPGSASVKAVASPSVVSSPGVASPASTHLSAATTTSRSSPAPAISSSQVTVASAALAELEALLHDLRSMKPAVVPAPAPAGSEPARELHREPRVAPRSPSRRRHAADGPAICPGRTLQRPPAAFRQASSLTRPDSVPGRFQGLQAPSGESSAGALADLENPLGGRAHWMLAMPRAGPLEAMAAAISRPP